MSGFLSFQPLPSPATPGQMQTSGSLPTAPQFCSSLPSPLRFDGVQQSICRFTFAFLVCVLLLSLCGTVQFQGLSFSVLKPERLTSQSDFPDGALQLPRFHWGMMWRLFYLWLFEHLGHLVLKTCLLSLGTFLGFVCGVSPGR